MIKKTKEYLIVILLFLIVAIVFTYPLILNFSSQIYAKTGDPEGMLRLFWQLPNINVDYSFPNASLYIFLAKIGTILFKEIITYNLFIIFGFILTGLSTYLLVKHIINNKLAAVFAGLVLAISSFRISHSLQHLNFSDLSGIIFFIYFLLLGWEKPSYKNITLAGLAFIYAALMNYQYGFFAVIIFIIYLITLIINKIIFKYKTKSFEFEYDSGYNLAYPPSAFASGDCGRGEFGKSKFNSKKTIIYSLIVMLISLAILTIPTYKVYKDIIALDKNQKTEVIPLRDKYEINVYSAKWFYYFLPSPENPLLGKYTKDSYEDAIKETGSNPTEMNLYLGITPLILLLYCYIVILFRKSQIPNPPTSEAGLKSRILFFSLLALMGLYFSFSPTIPIFGYNLKTPAYWLFDWLPFFRVYARFGLLVIIPVAILSGIGLSFILEQIKSKKLVLLLYCFITLLLITEFLNFPPAKTLGVDQAYEPKIYHLLETQTKGLIAEYPLLPFDEPKSYSYLLWQRYHQFLLLNDTFVKPEDDKLRLTLLDLQQEETIKKLADLGVKYLIIHEDKYTSENAQKYPEEYNHGTPPLINSDKLKLIGKVKGDKLYQIISF